MGEKLYCPFCGAPIRRNDKFCSNCGKNVEKITSKTLKYEEVTKRPLFLTVASILEALGGIFSIIFFFIILLLLSIASSYASYTPENSFIFAEAAIAVGSAVVLFIWGVVCLVAAYGLWKLKRYGGIIGIIEASIGATGSIIFIPFSLGNPIVLMMDLIFGIIYNLAIIALIALGWNYLK